MEFKLPLFPEQASTVAGQVDAFYLFLVLVTTFFSLLIALLILFFIIRYRRRPDQEAEQIHGSTLLEIVWTVIPLGISMVIFVWGAILTITLRTRPRTPWKSMPSASNGCGSSSIRKASSRNQHSACPCGTRRAE